MTGNPQDEERLARRSRPAPKAATFRLRGPDGRFMAMDARLLALRVSRDGVAFLDRGGFWWNAAVDGCTFVPEPGSELVVGYGDLATVNAVGRALADVVTPVFVPENLELGRMTPPSGLWWLDSGIVGGVLDQQPGRRTTWVTADEIRVGVGPEEWDDATPLDGDCVVVLARWQPGITFGNPQDEERLARRASAASGGGPFGFEARLEDVDARLLASLGWHDHALLDQGILYLSDREVGRFDLPRGFVRRGQVAQAGPDAFLVFRSEEGRRLSWRLDGTGREIDRGIGRSLAFRPDAGVTVDARTVADLRNGVLVAGWRRRHVDLLEVEALPVIPVRSNPQDEERLARRAQPSAGLVSVWLSGADGSVKLRCERVLLRAPGGDGHEGQLWLDDGRGMPVAAFRMLPQGQLISLFSGRWPGEFDEVDFSADAGLSLAPVTQPDGTTLGGDEAPFAAMALRWTGSRWVLRDGRSQDPGGTWLAQATVARTWEPVSWWDDDQWAAVRLDLVPVPRACANPHDEERLARRSAPGVGSLAVQRAVDARLTDEPRVMAAARLGHVGARQWIDAKGGYERDEWGTWSESYTLDLLLRAAPEQAPLVVEWARRQLEQRRTRSMDAAVVRDVDAILFCTAAWLQDEQLTANETMVLRIAGDSLGERRHDPLAVAGARLAQAVLTTDPEARGRSAAESVRGTARAHGSPGNVDMVLDQAREELVQMLLGQR